MIVAQIHRIVQIYVAGPVVEPQAFNAAMKETLFRIYGGKAIACWLTVLKYHMVRWQLFITTSNGVKSAAKELGYLQDIEQSGAIVLEGVCFYILQNLPQMRVREGWSNLVTNSAKLANIIGAHKFNTILRRTAECVYIACTGKDVR